MAKRLNDKDKQKIRADYVETGNYRETARMNNVSVDTVKRTVEEDNEIQQKLTQKKEENIKSTLEYMEEQHETKKRILDKLLKGIEVKAEEIDMFTNVKDLATAYGIILDKELKVLELQRNKGNIEDEINNNIQNIANLINNPEPNRSEADVQ